MSEIHNILEQYKQLDNSGALNTIETLRKENRILDRIINETGFLMSLTEIDSMLEYVISCILDHFIPDFFSFMVILPRIQKLSQSTYRRLQKTNEEIPKIYFDILRERFLRIPASTSFDDLKNELGEAIFGKDFLSLEPQFIFPMTGIGGVYGIAILGKKIVNTEYTDLERNYVEKLIKALSISLQNTLHYQSSVTDPKTGLFTHDYFLSRIQYALSTLDKYSRSFGLLMIDIDFFKKFNDRWGHLAGDLALIHIAKILQSCIRSEDCVSRFGGEEFAILISDTKADKLFTVAERIRKTIETSPVRLETGELVSTTVSIGVRNVERSKNLSALSLFEDADKALYQSKKNGRNKVTVFRLSLLEKAEHYHQ